MAGARLAGAYGMLAWRVDAAGDRVAVGWAQFGPISRYPRAQVIRERYPSLPDSPAPWVVTCLQVLPETADRAGVAAALLGAVCDELDRRGIIAVEAYPEGVADPWAVSAGTRRGLPGRRVHRSSWRGALSRPTAASSRAPQADVGWGDLLSHTRPPDEGDEWPLPAPQGTQRGGPVPPPAEDQSPQSLRRRLTDARGWPVGTRRGLGPRHWRTHRPDRSRSAQGTWRW